MNIGKRILFWICLGLFVCVFEELLLVILIVIAIYLGILIVKNIKELE